MKYKGKYNIVPKEYRNRKNKDEVIQAMQFLASYRQEILDFIGKKGTAKELYRIYLETKSGRIEEILSPEFVIRDLDGENFYTMPFYKFMELYELIDE